MKKNKLFIFFLVSVMILGTGICSVYAESPYTAELTTLSNLIEQCENNGISVEYEKVNYETIKRFRNNEMPTSFPGQAPDTMNTSAYTSYFNNSMQQLYLEAKNNMEGYLNGTLTPKPVDMFDINSTAVNGKLLKNGKKTVFSMGYLNKTSLDEIAGFNNVGATNAQYELGPDAVTGCEFGWTKNNVGSINVKTTVNVANKNVKTGRYSLRIYNRTSQTGNKYYRMYQNIPCEPGTSYEFGVSTRGNKNSAYMFFDSFSSTKYSLTAAADVWSENTFTFTAGEDQNTAQINLLVEGLCDLYIDDFFMYELDDLGVRTGDNLIFDAGFESGNKYYANLYNTISTLRLAKANNVGISLLLSPHYMTQTVHNLPSGLFSENTGFIKYNIDAPETKAVIEEYIRVLGQELNRYDLTALQNICISNEPEYFTTNFPDFYNPLFREYLQEIHGSIDKLNNAYGTSYGSFDEVSMPTDVLTAPGAVFYDWMEFNNKVLTDWHIWLAGEVRKYFHNIPINSKVLGINMRTEANESNRAHLSRGYDYELFDSFSDYSGVDTSTWVTNSETYYRTVMTYDFLSSITGKPIYDSEEHLIGDTENRFNDTMKKHIGNSLWMGAVHGSNMASLWAWRDTSSLGSNFTVRPDVVAKVGHTALDMIRLSDELAMFSQESPQVAILYSKPTRVYDNNYSRSVYYAYKSLINSGYSVGFVSDRNIEKLSQYKTLVITDAEYCKKNTLNTIKRFAEEGGTVIGITKNSTGKGLLSKNEYGQSIDNAGLLSNIRTVTEANSYSSVNSGLTGILSSDITVEKNNTKLSDIDFRYAVEDGRLLISITNLNYNSPQTGVRIKIGGKAISGLKNCITGETGISSFDLNGFEPVLLEYTSATDEMLGFSNGKLTWSGSGEDYLGANIYKISDEGVVYKPTFTSESESAQSHGTYFVRTVRSIFGESKGSIISIANNNAFSINVADYHIENDTYSIKYSVRNDSDSICHGIVCVELRDENYALIDYTYQYVLLKANEINYAGVGAETNGASHIRIVVYDSLITKNLLSEPVFLNQN